LRRLEASQLKKKKASAVSPGKRVVKPVKEKLIGVEHRGIDSCADAVKVHGERNEGPGPNSM